MKKVGLAMIVMLVWLGLAAPAWAAPPNNGQKIELWFDDMPVAELLQDLALKEPEAAWGEPVLRGGRVYLPARLAAALFGAEVEWPTAAGGIRLNWELAGSERELRLLVGSSQAEIDGRAVDIGAAPFVQAGRTYVPLRLVAEGFGCQTAYSRGRVDIRTGAWELEGRQICGLGNEIQMTARNYIYHNKSPYQARRLYELVLGSRGAEVAEPEFYGVNINLDAPNYYFQQHRFYLLTAESRFLNAWEAEELYGFYAAQVADYAQDFCIYVVFRNDFGFERSPLPEGYTNFLLEMDGHWFALPDEVGEAANGFGWGWEAAASCDRY